MKNELGIEVCCENCYLNFDCNLLVEKNCIINGQYLSFLPSIEASSKRIKELQEQLSNSMVILDEKEFIKTMKNRLESKNNE